MTVRSSDVAPGIGNIGSSGIKLGRNIAKLFELVRFYVKNTKRLKLNQFINTYIPNVSKLFACDTRVAKCTYIHKKTYINT